MARMRWWVLPELSALTSTLNSRRVAGCGWNRLSSLRWPGRTSAFSSCGRAFSRSKPARLPLWRRWNSAAAVTAAAMAPADVPPMFLKR